jgi:hypothetical protein
MISCAPGHTQVSGAGALRQRFGNQGVQRLMSRIVDHSKDRAQTRSPAIQAKLTISQPGDAHEREADRVADAVMRMPATQVASKSTVISNASPAKVQRMCTDCDEEHKHKASPQLQRKERAADTASLTSRVAANIQALRGGGNALSTSTRAFFEPRFGADFSSVRVHTDSQAANTANSLSARAFTVGRDIAFGAGQYAPHTQDGSRLLAHELTHVVQQGAAHAVGQAPNLVQSSASGIGLILARKPDPKVRDNAQLKSTLKPTGKAALYADQVASIYFASKGSVPDADDHKVLKALAEQYTYTAQRRGELKGKVIGHAALEMSADRDNEELSLQRARRTAAALKFHLV